MKLHPGQGSIKGQTFMCLPLIISLFPDRPFNHRDKMMYRTVVATASLLSHNLKI